MTDQMMDEGSKMESTERLVEAFSTFTRASTALESAYWELQERVEYLTDELEQSNYYLSSVLQSLPCGVLVIDEEHQVTMLNQVARGLFNLGGTNLPVDLGRVFTLASFSDRAREVQESILDTTEVRLKGGDDKEEKVLLCSWSRMRGGERVLVVQDVTRMRRLEDQMKRTERIAAMGEMALELAHEIRNPLGALELFASLLNEDDLSKEDRARYLSNIQIGIRSLNTVLTNMLTFSRSSSGDRQVVCPQEIIAEIVDFMEPLLKQRGIEASCTAEDDCYIEVDREMFRQVLTNLFTNALKALPQGGSLNLHTFQGEESVNLRMRDDGMGIPEKYQNMIFDPGFTTNPDGNGLGLAIVSRFMESHGGKISVNSRPGSGTEFLLEFPPAQKGASGGSGSPGESRDSGFPQRKEKEATSR